VRRSPTKRPKAIDDLLSHADEIATGDEAASIRFVDAVESTIEMLCEHPEIGGRFVTGRDELLDVRAKPVNGFARFVIFYFDRGNTLEVVRVLVGGQNMDALLESKG